MMKLFLNSVKDGFRFKTIGTIIYVIQLLLALTLGIQIYQVMEASIGHSAGLDSLLHQFDYSTFNDFLNVHGASISPIFGQLRYLLLVYALFSIFLNAGSLSCIVKDQNTWTSFWANGAKYFYPFLKIGLFFLFLFILTTGLIWLPILSNFEPAMEYFYTEKPYVWILIGAFPVYFLILSFIFLWSVNTRIEIIQQESKLITSLKLGLKKTRKQFWKSVVLLLCFALIMVLGTWLYLLSNETIGMISTLTILIFFILQQIIIFLRILWRFMIYSGINRLNKQANIRS